jgi:hypothetical protein
MENEISELKKELVKVMHTELVTQHWTLLKSGQRGGKNLVAELLIEKAIALKNGYLNILVHSMSMNFSKEVCEGFKKRFPNIRTAVDTIPVTWHERETILVLMDEAMWTSNSYDAFLQFKSDSRCRTIIISSRGPEYDKDMRWQLLSGHSFCTWDLNPNITLTDLLPNLTTTVVEPFLRDFCAY